MSLLTLLSACSGGGKGGAKSDVEYPADGFYVVEKEGGGIENFPLLVIRPQTEAEVAENLKWTKDNPEHTETKVYNIWLRRAVAVYSGKEALTYTGFTTGIGLESDGYYIVAQGTGVSFDNGVIENVNGEMINGQFLFQYSISQNMDHNSSKPWQEHRVVTLKEKTMVLKAVSREQLLATLVANIASSTPEERTTLYQFAEDALGITRKELEEPQENRSKVEVTVIAEEQPAEVKVEEKVELAPVIPFDPKDIFKWKPVNRDQGSFHALCLDQESLQQKAFALSKNRLELPRMNTDIAEFSKSKSLQKYSQDEREMILEHLLSSKEKMKKQFAESLERAYLRQIRDLIQVLCEQSLSSTVVSKYNAEVYQYLVHEMPRIITAGSTNIKALLDVSAIVELASINKALEGLSRLGISNDHGLDIYGLYLGHISSKPLEAEISYTFRSQDAGSLSTNEVLALPLQARHIQAVSIIQSVAKVLYGSSNLVFIDRRAKENPLKSYTDSVVVHELMHLIDDQGGFMNSDKAKAISKEVTTLRPLALKQAEEAYADVLTSPEYLARSQASWVGIENYEKIYRVAFRERAKIINYLTEPLEARAFAVQLHFLTHSGIAEDKIKQDYKLIVSTDAQGAYFNYPHEGKLVRFPEVPVVVTLERAYFKRKADE